MNSDLSLIKDLLWILIPVIIVQLTIMVIALIDWYKNRDYLGQNRLLWLLLILLVNMIGPIIYLIYSNRSLRKKDQVLDQADDWGI